MRRALITGITGQDGQFLAELLHEKGYQVFGLVKGQNNPKGVMVQAELPFVELISGDLQDLPSLIGALEQSQPDEVYNLGAISFVAMSWKQAELTANVTGTGVLRLLEAIRMVGGSQANPIRFYQASSSEMFGKVRETPQNEMTPFYPRSPYGVAKVFGHQITVNYRESYGLYACSGILFNHESERRGHGVRHPQGVQRRRPHQARRAGGAGHGRPAAQAGLGLRRRLRQGHVGHAPAGRARRLRRGHGRDPHRRGVRHRGVRSTPASTTGGATSARTRASCARPRSTSWSATPPRPTRCSAGSPRSTSTSWSSSWWTTT